jgi:hypothetical protein
MVEWRRHMVDREAAIEKSLELAIDLITEKSAVLGHIDKAKHLLLYEFTTECV